MGMIQCASCYCTLYHTNNNTSGITGEICASCQSTKDNQQHDDYDDDE